MRKGYLHSFGQINYWVAVRYLYITNIIPFYASFTLEPDIGFATVSPQPNIGFKPAWHRFTNQPHIGFNPAWHRFQISLTSVSIQPDRFHRCVTSVSYRYDIGFIWTWHRFHSKRTTESRMVEHRFQISLTSVSNKPNIGFNSAEQRFNSAEHRFTNSNSARHRFQMSLTSVSN